MYTDQNLVCKKVIDFSNKTKNRKTDLPDIMFSFQFLKHNHFESLKKSKKKDFSNPMMKNKFCGIFFDIKKCYLFFDQKFGQLQKNIQLFPTLTLLQLVEFQNNSISALGSELFLISKELKSLKKNSICYSANVFSIFFHGRAGGTALLWVCAQNFIEIKKIV